MSERESQTSDAREPAHVLLHVGLPDRPGALGLVASRIGAIRGDIVDVTILDHRSGFAVDQLTVSLPDAALLPMLVREVCEVDGVSVHAARLVVEPHDPTDESLQLVTRLVEASTVAELHRILVRGLMRHFVADWAVLVHGETVGTSAGYRPPLDELPEHGPDQEEPTDLAIGPLARHDAEVLLGRSDHGFFPRERDIVRVFARVADTAWSRLDV